MKDFDSHGATADGNTSTYQYSRFRYEPCGNTIAYAVDRRETVSEPWSDFCRRFHIQTGEAKLWQHRVYVGNRTYLGALIVDVQGAMRHEREAIMKDNGFPFPFLAYTIDKDEIRVIVPVAEPVPLRTASVVSRRKIADWVARRFGLRHGVDMSRSWFVWGFCPHSDEFKPWLPCPPAFVWRDGVIPTWGQLVAVASQKEARR